MKFDESPSNFSVIIPDDSLKKNKDEYFTLSVNSFYRYNDFYQCNVNCNSFNIIASDNNQNCYKCSIFNPNFPKLFLNVGNPNVYDLLSDINSKLSGYLTCTYDNMKNKITYKRIYIPSVNYFNMFIQTQHGRGFRCESQ